MKSLFTFTRPASSSAFACLLALALTLPSAAYARGDKDWKPLDPADLAASSPVVEKGADAEALFWEVVVDDSQTHELALKNYVRIKVFNERGRDAQSKVELPYYGNHRLKDIAARVIKPDGTVVELKKEDVFDRTVVKLSGVKVKVKSFALPGVEPGAVIEYRWREVRPYADANNLRLQFQRDIPARSVTYYLKPFMGMRYRPFNMGDARFEKDRDGFSRITVTNMPAFREEPRMPPEDSVRSWVFLYYSYGDTKQDAEQYWKDFGRRMNEALKDSLKVGDEVKAAAASAVGDAAEPEEKLRRIYDFCRTKIKNVNDDASGLTAEEREKFKGNKSPADTLKRGQGTGSDVDFLFAAMARAAGFDARLAFSGDNGDLFFERGLMHSAFLGSSFVAVRVGDGWQFYSPAETYTTFGMLGWREEGLDVLIPDAKEPAWARTPVAGPEKSAEKRAGKFRLAADGTLEGDVRIEYTGHLAYDKKEYNDDDSPEEREKTLRDTFRARLGADAELSDVRVENVNDPVKPFVYAFHVRVPGYAQRTGKRLFFQPGFFQRGVGSLFPTAERRHLVYFHHQWSEEDSVQIELPEGFQLDSAETPTPVTAGPVSKYEPVARVTKDGRTVVYTRKFYFGQNGQPLIFPVTTYPNLKAYFDLVSKQDEHTLAVKQGATAAAATPAPPSN